MQLTFYDILRAIYGLYLYIKTLKIRERQKLLLGHEAQQPPFWEHFLKFLSATDRTK
jgi:hypothetical protein